MLLNIGFTVIYLIFQHQEYFLLFDDERSNVINGEIYPYENVTILQFREKFSKEERSKAVHNM